MPQGQEKTHERIALCYKGFQGFEIVFTRIDPGF